MIFQIRGLSILSIFVITAMNWSLALSEGIQNQPGSAEEYCQSDSFNPRCLKNEVILITSAAYGRMRIGRCITVEEVEAQKLLAGDDPRILGCSEDVSALLDRRCSGKTDCEIRVVDMARENIRPCYPGLIVYLEASYTCVSVVDEERSCVVTASRNPVHISILPASKRICGTKSQPWTVGAPAGQKVIIRLLYLVPTLSSSLEQGLSKLSCRSFGVIVDVIRKENVSVCGERYQREKLIYVSTGNSVQIIFSSEDFGEYSEDNNDRSLLKLEAIGCSDIIPDEDTWMKRNDDEIVIGCYSSRQTWYLSCNGEKWNGVLGNCSQDVLTLESKSDIATKLSQKGQVLAIVAIGGFTLTICLTIACIGAIYLRRSYFQIKKKYEYKTLNYNIMSATSYRSDERGSSTGVGTNSASGVNGFVEHQAPTYSVYVGETLVP